MAQSNIEWTEESWNPVVGCSIVSPGCTNCYAMKMAHRIEGINAEARAKGTKHASQYDGTTKVVNGHAVWTGKLAMAGKNIINAPILRKKPTVYFVNSMGDLFHENTPDDWILDVLTIMAICHRHTFQVLTKRADRMREFMSRPGLLDDIYTNWYTFDGGAREVQGWPLPNVWLGVSAERQQEADERIPELLNTPAAVRFVSAEPLLGAIDLRPWLSDDSGCEGCDDDRGPSGGPRCHREDIPREEQCPEHFAVFDQEEGPVDEDGAPAWIRNHRVTLDWVIVGGESGPDARPMHPDWARSLKVQCEAAGVPFFFKQWGAFVPGETIPIADGARDIAAGTVVGESDSVLRDIAYAGHGRSVTLMRRTGKKAAGRALDGIEYNETCLSG